MIGYINEQVANAEESLRDYVNRWMSSSEMPARRTASGVQPVGVSAQPRRRFSDMAKASVPGAIAGAAMAFLVMFFMRPQAPATTPKQSEVVETYTAPAATATRDATPTVQPEHPRRRTSCRARIGRIGFNTSARKSRGVWVHWQRTSPLLKARFP